MSRRILLCAWVIVLVLASSLIRAADASLFNQAHFRASHNSYAASSAVGPIVRQLDAGVRFIELDIHDDDFAQHHDYRIGHLFAGQDLLVGSPNPASPNLMEWLKVINAWSDAHKDHAPITLALDIKGDLTKNISYSAGNMGFLNAQLERAFGKKLFTADDLGDKWPTIEQLRGRILIVLSGSLPARTAYRWDTGAHPAVAVNSHGQVVEVHDSGGGTLWYWTGQLSSDGRIDWIRHGRYDAGQLPAVALDDEGWLVEVHESESGQTVWGHVGHLGPDLEITWGPSWKYGQGESPAIRLEDGKTGLFREFHYDAGGKPLTWSGRIDRKSLKLDWIGDQPVAAQGKVPDKSSAPIKGGVLTVSTGVDGPAPPTTLLFSAAGAKPQRIHYRQLAFVEFQRGNPQSLADDNLQFFACSFKFLPWGLEWRQKGKIVRLWQVTGITDELKACPIPPANFPATDTPYDAWYDNYCQQIRTAR